MDLLDAKVVVLIIVAGLRVLLLDSTLYLRLEGLKCRGEGRWTVAALLVLVLLHLILIRCSRNYYT